MVADWHFGTSNNCRERSICPKQMIFCSTKTSDVIFLENKFFGTIEYSTGPEYSIEFGTLSVFQKIEQKSKNSVKFSNFLNVFKMFPLGLKT